MPRVRLYPEAPHLSASLYCEHLTDGEAFAALADAVRSQGAWGNGYVQVVAAGAEYDGVTDLPAGDLTELSVDDTEFDRLVAGRDPDRAVVKAEFMTREAGLLVVSQLRRAGSDRHPVDASVCAGDLGLPDFVRDAAEDRAAEAIAAWARGLFRAACEQID